MDYRGFAVVVGPSWIGTVDKGESTQARVSVPHLRNKLGDFFERPHIE
jgi:hypothetical protein